MPDAWIPPGSAVTVGPYRIADGMIYVGSDLRAGAGWGREAALIDPALPIRSDEPDYLGVGLSYRPSYSQLSPACRAAYLEWLAGGRASPNAPLGYVFLFYFGLERRLLLDPVSEEIRAAEWPILIAEIARLEVRYWHFGDFRHHATHLLAAISPPDDPDAAIGEPERPGEPGWPLGEAFGRGLRRLAASRRPLPADWAFAWLWSEPPAPLRTPALRCRAEFEALFKARYASAFGPGLRIKSRKTRIGGRYHPASPSLAYCGSIQTPGREDRRLIDTDALRAKLMAFAGACCQDLDAYSRYLGRNPAGSEYLAAVALLPRELLAGHPAAVPLEAWLERTIPGAGPTLVPASDLPPGFGTESARRDTLVVLADLAEKLGYGFEPDPRRTGRQAPAVTHLAFFRAPGDGRVRLECLALALSRLPAFTKDMRACLYSLKPADQKWVVRRIGTLAAGMALDQPARIGLMERLYESAGMGKQQAYRDFHGQICDPEPDALTTILARDRDRTTYRIPDPPPPTSGQPLDPARLARRIRETAEVASLLGAIFTESLEEDPSAPSNDAPGAPYRQLLRDLARADRWSRSDFQALCRPLGLPVDGTIESLNDLAFDAAGELLLEGTDPIFVSNDVLRMLT